ncbi:MAG TPA: hypothetical protein VLX92_34845 [Kofleriaceae bacterium]|nr:hypothetical protein [Kofleriaceae bacterium]
MNALLKITLLAAGLAACGDSKGQPIKNNPDGGGGSNDGSNGSDATSPTAVPLVVASSHGVLVYNDSAAITGDVAPDATITSGLTTGAGAVTVSGDRLYAGSAPGPGLANSTVLAFDDAHALTSSATPTATIARPYPATRMRVDGADNLWLSFSDGEPEIDRFAGASTLGSSATPTTIYTVTNMQVPGFAYEPTSDRLFVGQISGMGVLGWDKAEMETGMPTQDFTLSLGAYWTMLIDHDRIYGGGQHASGSTGVAIWPNASTVGGGGNTVSPIEVDVVGSNPGQFIADIAIRDDVLVVAARDQNEVLVYLNASQITANRAADFTITDTRMTAPSRLAIGPSGRLYVVASDGVVIFDAITTAPAFVAKLQTGVGTPQDVALAE